MPYSKLLNALQPTLDRVGLDSVSLIAALSQGLSNQNYYIRARRDSSLPKEWVLRVNSQASSQLCNRQAEVNNWTLAASNDLAPELTYVAEDFSCYLSEFIPQVSFDWAKIASAKNAHPLKNDEEIVPNVDKLILPLLKGLQALPLPDNHMSMTQQWQDYHQALMLMSQGSNADVKATSPAELGFGIHAELTMNWLAAFDDLHQKQTQVKAWLLQLDDCLMTNQFCHRDLNPQNILCHGEQLVAIDFEYACASHPLWDLAGILATHGLSSIQRHRLIQSYLHEHPNLTQTAYKAVPASIELYWVFAACWALLMAFSFLDVVKASAITISEMQKVKHDPEAVNLLDESINCAAVKAREYLDFYTQFAHYISPSMPSR
ncbi:phosphotransferase [Shewanella surugensis]|uniref:Cytochrome c oxidase assembly factor Coa1 family protein n=1 Tax=Shewanella surugensis TaxID=212020 RepID=A0ABT0L7J3_9GAMM|nr:phosphotransferase [Shewanella surugensis]MCL1123659.1 cytochrome c oxidase assembly factor Coa1 family protein [Shewanella surugensis]